MFSKIFSAFFELTPSNDIPVFLSSMLGFILSIPQASPIVKSEYLFNEQNLHS